MLVPPCRIGIEDEVLEIRHHGLVGLDLFGFDFHCVEGCCSYSGPASQIYENLKAAVIVNSSHTMPYTEKPTSFSDFVKDANGEAPILVYKAADCPTIPDALGYGEKCYAFHEEWQRNRKDYSESCPECPNGEYCVDAWCPYDFHSENPNYILVIPPSFEYQLPTHWLFGMTTYSPEARFDWILTSAEAVKRVLQEREPFAAIWAYDTGPRPFSQHGGDEDWTAVVRKSVYCVKAEHDDIEEPDELRFVDYLDCCGTSLTDEEDFRVFTGAHA